MAGFETFESPDGRVPDDVAVSELGSIIETFSDGYSTDGGVASQLAAWQAGLFNSPEGESFPFLTLAIRVNEGPAAGTVIGPFLFLGPALDVLAEAVTQTGEVPVREQPRTPRVIPIEVAAYEHLERVTGQRDRALDLLEQAIRRGVHPVDDLETQGCDRCDLGEEIARFLEATR